MRCRYRLHLDLSYFNINLNVDCVTLPPGGHEDSWCDAAHLLPASFFSRSMRLNDAAAVGTLGMSAAASAPPPPSTSQNSTRLKHECSARYAVVIGSAFLKSECDAYDRGSYALAAGTCARRFDLPLLPPQRCSTSPCSLPAHVYVTLQQTSSPRSSRACATTRTSSSPPASRKSPPAPCHSTYWTSPACSSRPLMTGPSATPATPSDAALEPCAAQCPPALTPHASGTSGSCAACYPRSCRRSLGRR
jgi:hypothetical protein